MKTVNLHFALLVSHHTRKLMQSPERGSLYLMTRLYASRVVRLSIFHHSSEMFMLLLCLVLSRGGETIAPGNNPVMGSARQKLRRWVLPNVSWQGTCSALSPGCEPGGWRVPAKMLTASHPQLETATFQGTGDPGTWVLRTGHPCTTPSRSARKSSPYSNGFWGASPSI